MNENIIKRIVDSDHKILYPVKDNNLTTLANATNVTLYYSSVTEQMILIPNIVIKQSSFLTML